MLRPALPALGAALAMALVPGVAAAAGTDPAAASTAATIPRAPAATDGGPSVAAPAATEEREAASVAKRKKGKGGKSHKGKRKGGKGKGGKHRRREPAAGKVGGVLKLRVSHAHRVAGRSYAMVGSTVRIGGVISRWAPHQKVYLRVYDGRKLALERRVRVYPSKSRHFGRYSIAFKTDHPTTISASAVHKSSRRQIHMRAKPARYTAIERAASFGTGGATARVIQQRLSKLGYAVNRTGVYDAATGRAVKAYRRVNGMSWVESADSAVIGGLLDKKGRFKARYPDHGKHVEADLSRQIVVLLNGGRVHRVYITSSGKPSTPTILGHFRFYLKQPGYNSEAMLDSNYFIRGYAIHGYASVPNYPASHGCLRIPIPNASSVYGWIDIGDGIDVYR